MKRSGIILLVFSVLAIASYILVKTLAPQPQKLETITVSSAASMKEALMEVQKHFEEENKNIKLQFNFGASGALKKQIEEGAPVDLFIAADTKSIDDLDAKRLVIRSSVKDLFENELVLLVNREYGDRIGSIADLAKAEVKNIAIGVPESVPAGAYAKECIIYYKLWESLSPKLVYGKDVKQVMAYVESGDAMAGIVYSTDARLKENSVMVQVLPENSHSPILYASAVVASSMHQAAAQQFMSYLCESKAQGIFEKHGFTIIKD